MTIRNAPVFNWRTSGLDWDAPPYESPSPNLVALLAHLMDEFGGGSMGIHGDRPTTSGAQSEHSWGAALDWGWNTAQIDYFDDHNLAHGPRLTPAEARVVIDWIVDNSEELHVQSIVDIGRSWKCDRIDNGANGWIDYHSGYTGHAHIVTDLEGFFDDTPITARLTPTQENPMFDPYIQLPPAGRNGKPWFYVEDGGVRIATALDVSRVPVANQFRDDDPAATTRYDLIHEQVLGRVPA